MVAGRHPKGYPVDTTPPHSVDRVARNVQLTYGHDCKFHEITGLPLQQGIGSLPPDEQALHDHVPLIAQRDGIAAAREVRAQLLKRRTQDAV
jgi:hypothetical protein